MKKAFFLLCFALFTAPSVFAATYYVDPSGSDSNAGTSSSAPLSTLSKGVSKLIAGDTLYVSGNYTTQLNLTKSGSAGQPISVIGINSPRLDVGTSTMGINMTGSYLIVSGFTVTGGSSYGIYTEGQHNEIRNNIIKNSVRENGTGPCLNNPWGSALKLRIGADDIKIIGNTISENCGEGMGITRAKNVLIENNTVYDNFSVNIYIDNSNNVTVKNNTSLCSNPLYYRSGKPAGGIVLGTENYTGWGNQFHDILIDRNALTGCNSLGYYSEIGYLIQSTDNIVISNNTFTGMTSPFVKVPGAISTNNILTSTTVSSPSTPISSTPTPTRAPVTSSTSIPVVATATPITIPVASTCPPTGNTGRGIASMSVTVNQAGNYKAWVQMKGNGDAANSIWLQLDGLYCVKVGDLAGMQTGSWTWVDYVNGNTTTKIPSPLIAAGTHTLTLIGNAAEPGVAIERVLLTKDTACMPSGNGDTCIGVVSTPTGTPTGTPSVPRSQTVTPTATPIVLRSPTVTPTSIPSPVAATYTPTPTPQSLIAPTIQTTSLPTGKKNTQYTATIVAIDQTPSDVLTVSVSGLPNGISLKTCTMSGSGFAGVTTSCTISGTPTQRRTSYPKFTVKDISGNISSKTLNLQIK